MSINSRIYNNAAKRCQNWKFLKNRLTTPNLKTLKSLQNIMKLEIYNNAVKSVQNRTLNSIKWKTRKNVAKSCKIRFSSGVLVIDTKRPRFIISHKIRSKSLICNNAANSCQNRVIFNLLQNNSKIPGFF